MSSDANKPRPPTPAPSPPPPSHTALVQTLADAHVAAAAATRVRLSASGILAKTNAAHTSADAALALLPRLTPRTAPRPAPTPHALALALASLAHCAREQAAVIDQKCKALSVLVAQAVLVSEQLMETVGVVHHGGGAHAVVETIAKRDERMDDDARSRSVGILDMPAAVVDLLFDHVRGNYSRFKSPADFSEQRTFPIYSLDVRALAFSCSQLCSIFRRTFIKRLRFSLMLRPPTDEHLYFEAVTGALARFPTADTIVVSDIGLAKNIHPLEIVQYEPEAFHVDRAFCESAVKARRPIALAATTASKSKCNVKKLLFQWKCDSVEIRRYGFHSIWKVEEERQHWLLFLPTVTTVQFEHAITFGKVSQSLDCATGNLKKIDMCFADKESSKGSFADVASFRSIEVLVLRDFDVDALYLELPAVLKELVLLRNLRMQLRYNRTALSDRCPTIRTIFPNPARPFNRRLVWSIFWNNAHHETFDKESIARALLGEFESHYDVSVYTTGPLICDYGVEVWPTEAVIKFTDTSSAEKL